MIFSSSSIGDFQSQFLHQYLSNICFIRFVWQKGQIILCFESCLLGGRLTKFGKRVKTETKILNQTQYFPIPGGNLSLPCRGWRTWRACRIESLNPINPGLPGALVNIVHLLYLVYMVYLVYLVTVVYLVYMVNIVYLVNLVSVVYLVSWWTWYVVNTLQLEVYLV